MVFLISNCVYARKIGVESFEMRDKDVKRGKSVTPVFPKKTKCKHICMPGSSFMHIVDISE
jgi:hypothetical protein